MENLEKLIYDLYKKNARQCTNEEIYNALLIYTKNQLFEKGYQDGKKKIYYISAEFLIGKLLSNNLINLGIYDDVAAFLKENGKAIADIEEVEPEPSLGNGGLGRLAACFLDSIATLGLPGEGIGLNYHLGLFKQLFENRLQKETPNPWIEEHSWLTPAGVSYTVPFRGFSLKSSLYDIDVAGYNNKSIHLHLFDIDLADESMVHDGISFNKKDILHNLTLFLYPDDSDDDGRKLRIFQQYFMVSNAAQFILDEATKKGCNLHDLADYAVIQINDTHPSMVIPELIRLLTERGIDFDEAAEIVSNVCAYTNHTILAEALEKLDFPVVIKAVDLMGSRGIFRCDTSEQAFSFYEKTMEATGKDYCLVEEFIEGEPFGCEAMMSEGRLLYCLPNNIDAFQSYVPTPVGHSVPWKKQDSLGEEAKRQVKLAICAVGLDNCAVNCDLIEKDGKVYVIEITGRAGATCLPETVGLYYGINYYAIVRLALDMEPEKLFTKPYPGSASLSKILTSDRSGTVKAIRNENAPAEDIIDLSFNIQPGDYVNQYRNGRDRIGQIILAGKELHDCEERLDEILSKINIEFTV